MKRARLKVGNVKIGVSRAKSDKGNSCGVRCCSTPELSRRKGKGLGTYCVCLNCKLECHKCNISNNW